MSIDKLIRKSGNINPCPFCGDKMKATKSIINKDMLDAVKHIESNNNCPVGRGIYKKDVWNKRAINLKRYKNTDTSGVVQEFGTMREDKKGAWVKFSDVLGNENL